MPATRFAVTSRGVAAALLALASAAGHAGPIADRIRAASGYIVPRSTEAVIDALPRSSGRVDTSGSCENSDVLFATPSAATEAGWTLGGYPAQLSLWAIYHFGERAGTSRGTRCMDGGFAVRAWQAALGDEPTGFLTAAQGARLVDVVDRHDPRFAMSKGLTVALAGPSTATPALAGAGTAPGLPPQAPVVPQPPPAVQATVPAVHAATAVGPLAHLPVPRDARDISARICSSTRTPVGAAPPMSREEFSRHVSRGVLVVLADWGRLHYAGGKSRSECPIVDLPLVLNLFNLTLNGRSGAFQLTREGAESVLAAQQRAGGGATSASALPVPANAVITQHAKLLDRLLGLYVGQRFDYPACSMRLMTDKDPPRMCGAPKIDWLVEQHDRPLPASGSTFVYMFKKYTESLEYMSGTVTATLHDGHVKSFSAIVTTDTGTVIGRLSAGLGAPVAAQVSTIGLDSKGEANMKLTAQQYEWKTDAGSLRLVCPRNPGMFKDRCGVELE